MNTEIEIQKIKDDIKSLQDAQREVLELLRPISETYRTVSTLSTWFMSFAVFISIIIGIWLGYLQIKGK